MDALLETTAPSTAVVRAKSAQRVCDPQTIFLGLSREICRPLISLRAGFDLLLAGSEGPISDEQRRNVLGLRGHCDDLIRLTRTYLDCVGLTRSARPLEWGSYRLGALIDETKRQFSDRAWARGIAWECNLEGQDALVETDLACFQQMLACIVENSLNHSQDEATARVVGRFETDAWLIEVSDSGPGIPAADLTRVFEPLVRLRNGKDTAASSSEGFGMGLAVCRELVAHLGAEISFNSSTDSGTSVTVRFPLPSSDAINK